MALQYECESVSDETRAEFKKAAEPLIKFINDNYHPHCSAIVDCSSAELLIGKISHQTDKYIND